MLDNPTIPFIDLAAQQKLIKNNIDKAIQKVLESGAYIMGPQVLELEEALATFCGAKHAITCADGTMALTLGLMAQDIKPGQAVLVPTFTFAATAEAVALTGAIPLFIDVHPRTFNIDIESLKLGITTAKKLNLKLAGILPVDLFGQMADYEPILDIAKENNLWVIEDAAQSFGASYKGKKACTVGDIATTSFFPAKPLGCYGDGGAIFTNNDKLASIIKSLRLHGQGSNRYEHIHIGVNGRLDTLQAAILLEKLKIFDNELIKRNEIAKSYNNNLSQKALKPLILKDLESTWAQYTLTLHPPLDRAKVMQKLHAQGIPTMVYYPKPLHQQLAFKDYPCAGLQPLKNAEDICQRVLSLPMHPYLDKTTQDKIISTFNEAIE